MCFFYFVVPKFLFVEDRTITWQTRLEALDSDMGSHTVSVPY